MPWPGQDSAKAADFCLSIDLSSWRPQDQSSPHLVVEVEGIKLFDSELDKAVGRRTLAIPARSIRNANLRELEIKILADTWSADAFSGQRDLRELGVLIYGMQVRPLDQCPGAQ